ncbi:hypothetical protein NL676_006478 [Syzygium grande]|nr:hypothetical protein NL676_006478 [Syzygium grande]
MKEKFSLENAKNRPTIIPQPGDTRANPRDLTRRRSRGGARRGRYGAAPNGAFRILPDAQQPKERLGTGDLITRYERSEISSPEPASPRISKIHRVIGLPNG